jgi:hypothetical protein
MPCRRFSVKIAGRPLLPGTATAIFAALLVLAVSGCGAQPVGIDPLQRPEPNDAPQHSSANDRTRRSSDDETPGAPSRLLAMLLGAMTETQKHAGQTSPNAQNQHIFCPEVRVQEGAEASRVYAGTPPSSPNLRYQYELTDTARECELDGYQLSLKTGVAGKVLLGPAGTAGKFTVPVRMAIFRKSDNEPEVTKLYQATVNVGQSEAQAAFTIVSEPLRVPLIQDHSEKDYMIRVGIEEGNATGDKARSRGKR